MYKCGANVRLKFKKLQMAELGEIGEEAQATLDPGP